ncbi:hypothetical protein [Ferruginibacter sp. HRS2-29]|uniref:hypothetical protein n=1 Tax=Ferruginibacter sp. HRS2-29 TaxID=2487334 RepID=UPI0020CD9EC1|nr:hypothetical protein [Ferruginibacter sp. HRS2-29]MCP9750220.1 hypothetical protein [Ferruginibacter sp. HRS2-29]
MAPVPNPQKKSAPADDTSGVPNKIQQYLTGVVTLFLFAGVIIIALSQMSFYSQWFNDFTDQAIRASLKLIGSALLGSGVFTAIIKSDSYAKIFSKIIGEIIWSKKFIEKRQDKEELWSMVSSVMYEEKFPDINEDLEKIIMYEYLPTNQEYYIQDYKFLVNINHKVGDFWQQNETISFNIIPKQKGIKFTHEVMTSIQHPLGNIQGNDLTACKVTRVMVNDEDANMTIPDSVIEDGYTKHSMSIPLESDCAEYRVQIQREKMVDSIANNDKRMFSTHIVKDMEITVISRVGINIGLHPGGTINSFIPSDPEINGNSKMMKWAYKGLILPKQGFILIFK